MTYAEISKAVRETLKISQETLADMIGSNQTEISFLERGFVPKNANKIANLLQIARDLQIQIAN